MKKVKIPLDEFINQLQKIQADMAGVAHHPFSNNISFYLQSENEEEAGEIVLCEDEYDPAIEADYHMGCRCTLGAIINLINDDDNNSPPS